MTTYAADTTVPVERSRAEVERLLTRYGADRFASGWDGDKAYIMFRAKERTVKFVLDLPRRDDKRFALTPTGRTRNKGDAAEKAWEQELRRLWRALALVVKAKLEAVESGISDFESEFLSHIQLPDGTMFGPWAKRAIASVYDTGHALPAHVEAAEKGPHR